MSALQRRLAQDQERICSAGMVSGTAAVAVPPVQPEIITPATTDIEGPPSDADVKAVQKATAAEKKVEEAERLKAAMSTLQLFFDQHGASRLQVHRDNGRLDVPLTESTDATDYIRSVLEGASDKRASREVIESVVSRLRTSARATGVIRTVHLRVGNGADAVLLDMARPDGAVIHIDATGHRVQPQGDTLFLRGSGTGALPEPEQVTLADAVSTLQDYFSHLGIQAADDDVMLVLLADWIRPETPKPLLEITGTAGAGKTSAAVGLMHITDPTASGGLPSMRLTEEDVMAALQHRYGLHVDNANRLTADQQDLLCRICTGGVLMHRKLYEQGTVVAVTMLNPMTITGITPVITRSDARSRTIAITLKPRVTGIESAIDVRTKFEALHPRLLGAVCAILSAGLAGLNKVKSQRKYEHRLADFEQLGEAIHQARGWPPGEFGRIMAERRRTDAARVAEEDGLIAAIVKAIDKYQVHAVVRMAPPPARQWAKTVGATAWLDGTGNVFIAFTMRQLLKEVQHGMPFGDGDRVPGNEKALRHAITHKQPTFEALGWTVTLRNINDRSGVIFGKAGV